MMKIADINTDDLKFMFGGLSTAVAINNRFDADVIKVKLEAYDSWIKTDFNNLWIGDQICSGEKKLWITAIYTDYTVDLCPVHGNGEPTRENVGLYGVVFEVTEEKLQVLDI